MPYDIQWLVQDRVVYTYNHGIFTSEDLLSVFQEIEAMTEAGDAPVHLIVNSLDIERSQISIQDIRGIVKKKSEKSGWVIQITKNPFERFVSSMANQLFQTRYKHVDSLEQALHVIARLDESLEDIQQRLLV